MSHFAELDKNNKVIRVLVCDNNDPKGDEGYSWLIENLGGTWVQTSYNRNFRGNFAGIGFSYLENEDIFMPPKCHENATLNSSEYIWDCTNAEHAIRPNANG